MSDNPCHYHEDAAGWVLGALSEAQAQRFAAHLRDCPSCRAEAGRLAEAAQQLLMASPLVRPRPELRERLLAAVQQASPFDAVAAASSSTGPGRRVAASSVWRKRRVGRSPLRTSLLVIAASVVAVVGVLAWSDRVQVSSTRTVLGHVALRGGAPRAGALVSIAPDKTTLVLTGLAAPPAGLVYQAWVVPGGSPAIATGALFSVPSSGNTRILLPSLRRVARVIVTAEPPRGSPTPTLPAIVVVDLEPSRQATPADGGAHA